MAKRTSSRGLTLLGKSESRLPSSPDKARLETFPNPAKRQYRIRFETADFTSLCPVTGQMDFAQITIEYVPAKLCVETKSLKFYLASYRNERAFNEAVALLRHLSGIFLTRGTAQQVSFSERISGKHVGDLHHLHLIDDHAGQRPGDQQERRRREVPGHPEVGERDPLGSSWELGLSHPFFTDLQSTSWRGSIYGLHEFFPIVRPANDGLAFPIDRTNWEIGGLSRLRFLGRLALGGLVLSGRRRAGADSRAAKRPDAPVAAPAPALLQALADAHVAECEFEPYADARATLDGVRARGLRLGLISNAWPSLEGKYRRLGFRDYFDPFVISARAGCLKPDAAIFQFAVAQIGLPPERLLFVDDEPEYVRGACAGGLGGVLIARTGPPPGYDGPWIATLSKIERLLDQ